MKILYVITKSNWGGAQKYVFDLAVAMKNKNHEVLVAFGGNGLLKEKLEKEKIKIIQIKDLERDISFWKDIKVFFNLYKIIQKEKPEIIHLNSSKIGIVGSILSKIIGIKKIIFTAHGFPFREDRNFISKFIIKILSYWTILFSNTTICVSKKDLEDVKNWPLVKNKIITIHNGIDIKEYENINNNINNKKIIKENENKDKIKIISIGELHKNKGFTFALKAISLLKKEIVNFSYTIFSFGGDEYENLKKEILDLELQDYVFLQILNEPANKKLKDFDIYFLSSIKEGLPFVLLEAGINDLAIVASDTGGVKEIIENNLNGFLVKSKNITDFSEKLKVLILDKNLREKFSKNIKTKIIQEFSLEKMVKETEKVYNKKY